MDNGTLDSSPNLDWVLLESWNAQLAWELLPLDIVLALYLMVGVIGNVLVLYIYSFRLRRVSLTDKFFVQVLAAVDTFVCLSAPAFSLSRNLLPVLYDNNVVCKFAWFFSKDTNAISVLIILLIGIQRFLRVCRPLGRQLTLRDMKISLFVIITFASITHFPIFIFYGQTNIIHGNLTGKHCGRIHGFAEYKDKLCNVYLIVVFVTAVICMLLISLVYGTIWNKLRIHMKRRESFSSTGSSRKFSRSRSISVADDSQSKDNARSVDKTDNSRSASLTSQSKINLNRKETNTFRPKHRYTYMFIVISAVCLVSYFPLLMVNILVHADDTPFWTQWDPNYRVLVLFAFQFFIINHVANPFIYGFFDTRFRKEIVRVVCKICKRTK